MNTNLVSRAELARRLNVCEPRLRRVLKLHGVKSDMIAAGRIFMFDLDRIEEIRSLVQAPAPAAVAATAEIVSR